MRKSAAILLLAVLLPSAVLGWLALRGADEQRIILERRTAELAQRETDSIAAAARALVDEQRAAFADAVRELLAKTPASELAPEFTAALARHWKQPAVGFAIDQRGALLAPSSRDATLRPKDLQFLKDNDGFLGNKLVVPVYPVPVEELKGAEMVNRRGQSQQRSDSRKRSSPLMKDSVPQSQTAPPAESAKRKVAPQQQVYSAPPDESQIVWTSTGFLSLTDGVDEGVINRFVQDRLNMIFWFRPAQAREMIFGCAIPVEELRSLWPRALPETSQGSVTPTQSRAPQQPEFILALLDDKTRPVAVQPPGARVANWKSPFVATEVGEALPHWEAALYLARPEQLTESAHSVRRTLLILIATALGAIAVGGGVVLADVRRQLLLVQQKTDFVSNVSHELKTPLTSIRMFAELMQSGRADSERVPQYLRIIMVEAERLTRLINNVLDFARMERRQKYYDRRPLDLHDLLARVWEGQELHLQEAGFTTRWDAAPPPYPVTADEDALAQVLVNLLSNAEKYSGEQKEVTLQSYIDVGRVCIAVLDRGMGVPPGEEVKIFEPFYRANDSLSSGVQGAGLGLTLAQRVVREHRGDILYQARPGGGSIFTLRLPLRTDPLTNEEAPSRRRR